MNITLAIRTPHLLKLCQSVIKAQNSNFTLVSDAAELKHILCKFPQNLVMAEAYIESEPTFTLIREHADCAWIVFLNEVESLGAACYISSLGPRVTVLASNPCIADLIEIFNAAQNNDLQSFEERHQRYKTAWFTAGLMFPGSNGESDDQTDLLAQKLWLTTHFSARLPADCASVSQLSILCRIVREHQNGILTFSRDNIFVNITWKGGLPIDISTNESFLNVNQLVSLSADSVTDDKNKDSATRSEQLWIAEIIRELTRWRVGKISWNPVLLDTALTPKLAELDLYALLYKSVFSLPQWEIENATRALLPFNLHLTVAKNDALRYLSLSSDGPASDDSEVFSSIKCKAIVERLQKSGTLYELLMYLPDGYPIHQTIYLLLAQGCLDID